MAALIQYHGDGVQTELVQLEYAEICAAIELEKCESSDTVEEIQAHWLTILSSHWLYNLEINGQHQNLPERILDSSLSSYTEIAVRP